MTTPAFISALKSDRCFHYLNNSLVNRAQSFDISANVPTELIDELGNTSHSGAVSSPAQVSLSLSVFDTGITLAQNLTGKTASTSLALSDFANAQIDYVGMVRDNAGNFYRSVYVRDACITNLSYGYDVSGNAVETYSLAGDNLTVFDGFVLTKTYTVLAADVTNGYFTLPTQGEEAPIQTKANSYFGGVYLLSVSTSLGGTVKNLIEGNDYSYTPATKRITASGLVAGQVWTILFYSAAIGTALAPAFNAAIPAVKGQFTPVSLGVGSKTLIPRLQSAKINVDFGQKSFSQLGSSQVLFVPGGAPNVSGNFNVLMNDLSLRKLLTYGAAGSTETQFGIEQIPAYGSQNNLGLEAVVKSPTDNSVLKRITVPDVVVSNGGMPASVNGMLTENFAWTGKTGALTISNS